MKNNINISTLIVTFIGVILFYASFSASDADSYLFPRIIAVGIVILTILLWFEKGGRVNKTNFKALLPYLVLAPLYILSLKILGFYTSSMVFFFYTYNVL